MLLFVFKFQKPVSLRSQRVHVEVWQEVCVCGQKKYLQVAKIDIFLAKAKKHLEMIYV